MRLGSAGRRFQNRQEGSQFYRQIWQRVSEVPGVQTSGGVSALPFTGSVGWGGIEVEGFFPKPGQELQVDIREATPNYFRTMEIPLKRGRFFSDQDFLADPTLAAMVDEKFAERFWPHENPVGKQVWFNPQKKMSIVGVVGNVKQYGLDVDGRIVVYLPGAGDEFAVARTTGDPSAAANAMVRAIQSAAPAMPIFDIRTMEDRMHDSMARQRFSTIMLGAFAVFALILAAVGVYGMISYLVTQGTHDIGVRIALGAQRSNIVRLVVRQGMELAIAGIAIGVVGALLLTRLMASLLFGVSATDAWTFTAVPLVLAAVALAASYVPARRATTVDPMVALREE